MLNKGPVTQSFDIFFFFNNLLSKHSSFHWFQIPWCAYDVTAMFSFQFELLYIEVLYTIKHKIGTTTSGHSPFIQDLYHYAREAFGVTQEEHARLLAKASEEKVGLYLYHHCRSWWLSVILHYLPCISNGDTAVLYKASDLLTWPNCLGNLIMVLVPTLLNTTSSLADGCW